MEFLNFLTSIDRSFMLAKTNPTIFSVHELLIRHDNLTPNPSNFLIIGNEKKFVVAYAKEGDLISNSSFIIEDCDLQKNGLARAVLCRDDSLVVAVHAKRPQNQFFALKFEKRMAPAEKEAFFQEVSQALKESSKPPLA